MLIAKGYDVSFKLEGNSKKVAAPSSFAMLHDPEGASWPASSVLIAAFMKKGDEINDDFAEDYFGDPPLGGKINLPPLSLDSWKLLGSVKEINYDRRRPNGLPAKYEGPYYHVFDGTEGLFGWAYLIFKAPAPQLYRRGRMLRLELPWGADLNDRGYIWP
jgi:hypothetical protein